MKLKGKRAIITGSTKGIGLAIARALVGEGVSVVISSRNQKAIDRIVSQLGQASNQQVVGKQCDVIEADQCEILVNYCVEKLGGLDILVNNAGVGLFKKVEEMSVQEWRNVLSTNLDGVFFNCRFAIPEMKKSGEGFIVNIGSLAGKNAFPQGAAYNASKFGLTGFSEALMQEVRHDDIQVAHVMPGSVDTGFGNNKGSHSWKLSSEDVARVVVETLSRDARCLTSQIEMRPSKPPSK